jgi:hypothetical protein
VFTEFISEENTDERSDKSKVKIIGFTNLDDASGTSSVMKESTGLPVTPIFVTPFTPVLGGGK